MIEDELPPTRLGACTLRFSRGQASQSISPQHLADLESTRLEADDRVGPDTGEREHVP